MVINEVLIRFERNSYNKKDTVGFTLTVPIDGGLTSEFVFDEKLLERFKARHPKKFDEEILKFALMKCLQDMNNKVYKSRNK